MKRGKNVLPYQKSLLFVGYSQKYITEKVKNKFHKGDTVWIWQDQLESGSFKKIKRRVVGKVEYINNYFTAVRLKKGDNSYVVCVLHTETLYHGQMELINI